ncbi:hypothetical protein C0J52_15519 [Blattella germanica]|nr:hypothetical protein C0J52_15519 [Blattella germanica]
MKSLCIILYYFYIAENEPVPAINCTVHEVRISPCAEAADNKPCKIKKRHSASASIEFDFTASAATDTLRGQAFWPTSGGDLPFVRMNTDACIYTSCPVHANWRQTYEHQLNIFGLFPLVGIIEQDYNMGVTLHHA